MKGALCRQEKLFLQRVDVAIQPMGSLSNSDIWVTVHQKKRFLNCPWFLSLILFMSHCVKYFFNMCFGFFLPVLCSTEALLFSFVNCSHV